MKALVVVAAVAALAAAAAPRGEAARTGLPSSWTVASAGPDGGVVYQGRIPNRFVPIDRRLSAVYLPPGYTAARRYRVVHLLHGMAGRPTSIWDGLHLADVADRLIAARQAQPFIAVMPVAGPTVDIGLRHPGTFGTLGSWEGYFAPVFRDGPFVGASAAVLRAHDPTLLVRHDAARLRRSGIRFYVSAGGNHGDVLSAWTIAFARELTSLRLAHELWTLPTADRGHFWRATLPSALLYAGAPIPKT